MEEGSRKKEHHFCPTNPNALALFSREGKKLFAQAEDTAGINIFHLWPDKGAESLWCSCPSCRAFTPQEQYLIAMNSAADALQTVNPEASLCFAQQSSYSEMSGEAGRIKARKNLYSIKLFTS
jgi:hypothetical protein